MPTILQYYSTENNQADNSNGLPETLVATLTLFLLLQKWAHSHETIKQPISLKLQPIHLTTKLLGPLMTARLNFTNG